MTEFDRFDGLDRRIADALEEIAIPRRPEYLDDIFQLTAHASQRPRWSFLELLRPHGDVIRRRTAMNRLSLAAFAAVLVVAIAGGAYLFAPGRASVGAPSPSPSVAPSPTAPTATSLPAGVVAPARMIGDWVADPQALGLPSQGPRIQLSINKDGAIDTWVQTNYDTGTQAFRSRSIAAPDGQYRLVAVADGERCRTGDVGTYTWNRSADGLFLTLVLVSDQCVARSMTLARTWVHTLSAVTDGGPGVLPVMNIQATLPARRFGLAGTNFAGDVTTFDSSPFIGLMLNRDPIGFSDPCSSTSPAGASMSTVAEVVAYLSGIRGFNVGTGDVTIDGRAAIRVQLAPITDVTCPGTEVQLFRTPDGALTWSGPKTAVISFWVTQVGSDAWVFWYRGDEVTAFEEAGVIGSIHFITSLPTP
ncbi:MAG: hypothetical protein ABIV26_06100 [Candidatus Limnocylindrales bacterium]